MSFNKINKIEAEINELEKKYEAVKDNNSDEAISLSRKIKEKKQLLNKLNNYTISHFFIIYIFIAFIIAIVSSAIFVFGFVYPACRESKKYNDNISIYEKTNYDYIVYSPIDDQVVELSNNETIEKVFEYYSYNCSIELNGKKCDTKSIFSSNISNLNISTFNSKRIIEGTSEISNNEILLDEAVAKKINAEIGAEITLSMSSNFSHKFKVVGILETNYSYDNGTVFFYLSELLKTDIESKKSIKLSGILIKAKDSQSCYQYLKDNYMPLGELLTRDSFDSDVEYETYKTEFMSRDYSSRIYDKQVVLETLINNNSSKLADINSKIIIGSIISGIIMLSLIILPIIAKNKEKEFEIQTKTTIPAYKYRKCLNADNLISFCECYIICMSISFIAHNSIRVYDSLINKILTSLAISLIISLIIVSIVSNILISKINNKKF